MSKYNLIEIIPEELITKDSVKRVEDHVKLKILDKIKDDIFSDKYLIIKASIRQSSQIDLNKANLHIRAKLIINELTTKNLIDILNLIP